MRGLCILLDKTTANTVQRRPSYKGEGGDRGMRDCGGLSCRTLTGICITTQNVRTREMLVLEAQGIFVSGLSFCKS